LVVFAMGSFLKNSKFGTFESIMVTIESDLDKSSTKLLDTVHHRNEFQRKVFRANDQKVNTGYIQFELLDGVLSKSFDMDSKILSDYRIDSLQVMHTMYLSLYTIASFDLEHSITSTVDLKTQKITVTGTNIVAAKGRVYYMTIGRILFNKRKESKLKRR